MNKKINPALIGAFVLASMAMAIAAVMYFGASSYSNEKDIYSAYFRTETNGLEVGAPVVLQGVKIGNVAAINVGYDPTGNNIYVRVEFVTQRGVVIVPGSMQLEYAGNREKLTQSLIENGFRARLATQSLVTGKLMLELGFFPGTEVNLHTDDKLEIPTIPTTIQKLWQQLATLDLGKMGEGIGNIVRGIDELVNNVDLQAVEDEAVATLQSLQLAVADFRQLVGNLDKEIAVLGGNLTQVSDGVTSLVNNLDAQVDPLIQKIHQTLRSADTTLGAATSALNEADGLLSENSALRAEVMQALQNISDAARSLKGFADYLERHPEALLRGK